MSVAVECPRCRRRGRVNPVALPASVTCPGCGTVWKAPAASTFVPNGPAIALGDQVVSLRPGPVRRSRRAARSWAAAALVVGLAAAGLVVAALQGRLSGALPFPVPAFVGGLTAEQKAVRKHILDAETDPTAIRFERWYPVVQCDSVPGQSLMFMEPTIGYWVPRPSDRFVRVVFHDKTPLLGELRREAIYIVRDGEVNCVAPRGDGTFVELRGRYYGDED